MQLQFHRGHTIKKSDDDIDMHEGAVRYATAFEAHEAIRACFVRKGHRWVAKACAVCRGWHVELVNNHA